MTWFGHALLYGAILASVFLIVRFVLLPMLESITGLEQRQKKIDSASAELVKIVNRVSKSLFSPGELELFPAENMQDCLEAIKSIGYLVAAHTPALRRVLSFSIGMNLAYFREKTGITDEDLRGLEQQLAPEAFWPATSMIIEEWATHTVIRDFSGQRDILYPGQPLNFLPIAIWRHALPKRQGEYSQAYLEVVLHERCIKFWALDGRFGRRIPPEPAACTENVFVVIPLEEKSLAAYRSPSDEPSEDLETQLGQKPWIRHYDCGYISEEPFKWYLTVNDVVAYITDQYNY